MVQINYQTYGKGFNLRLRFYKDGETRFINVNKMLQGNLQKKHWNIKMKCFYNSAPNSAENNDVLMRFAKPYREHAKTWNGSLGGFMASFEKEAESNLEAKNRTLIGAISLLIEEMKVENRHEDGTLRGGFEDYEKLQRRLEEYCNDRHMKPESLLIDDMTQGTVNSILTWAKNRGKGKCYYVSSALRATLNRLSKKGEYDFSQAQNCEWFKKGRISEHKYITLSDDQRRRFFRMPVNELPKSKNAELFRDFCIFIFYTCQSACDAISLRYDDIRSIDGHDYFVFKRRKIESKQSKECTVPINNTMKRIMKKYKSRSQDGYIFPIRSVARIKANKVNNGDIKHFLNRLNTWLKELTETLSLDFDLHTYVFRHSGITYYVSKQISTAYISDLAGTSISNIEQIYYNSRGDIRNRDIVLMADED